MSVSPSADWPEYDRRTYGGYVYVIEYDTGVVKVGRTMSPRNRLAQHRSAARAHGVTIARRWLSEPHAQHEETEKALIAAACRLGERLAEESFRAAFHDVVAVARSLRVGRYVPAPPFESPARLRAAERRQRARALRAEGMSIRRIAGELGISVATVHNDVRAEGPSADEFYAYRQDLMR